MLKDTQRKRGDPFYMSKLWRKVRAQIIGRDHNTCTVCKGIFTGRDLQVDHIVPRKVAPHLAYAATNLRTLCRSCHTRAPTSMARGADYKERPFVNSSGYPVGGGWDT
jgi:5-methylcytosine-specific restriction endonuclease McrA